MPKVTAGGIDINYQIQGKGNPLLLIIGLSFSLLDWGTVFPDLLAQHYKVILFDNRDSGESSLSSHPYTIAQMADDAANLLVALGEPKAHVLGVSMGGMIAQHFALNHANKLNKLILGCTAAGGACSEFGDISKLMTGDLLDLLFTPNFIQSHQADLINFFQSTMPYRSQGTALHRQILAMSSHDTCNTLSKITASTLVIAGDQDPAIPAKNSDFLSQNIQNVQQITIKGASHGFCFSHAAETSAAIVNFLQHP